MSDTIIFHHYENSPYAEKIRLMFGLANSEWSSLLSPVWPPRPNVDPLAGGYRRIPVAQIGADIFCDTALIAQEVAARSGLDALSVDNMDEGAKALMQRAEQEAFFAAVAAVPPLRLASTMLMKFGPIGMYRFAKDRGSMMKGAKVARHSPEASQKILATLCDDLEQRLAQQPWIAGAEPSIADFTVFHPLWLHCNCNRKPLAAGPKVLQWFENVQKIGQGQRKEISADVAFAAARDSEPRAVPDSVEDAPAIGTQVAVAPADYGMQEVVGTLAALTADRIIIARDTADFGLLHVHFPRQGYSLSVS